MKIEVDGIQYDNFTSTQCDIRLDALTNVFYFKAAKGDPLPFSGGESCKIIIDDIVILTGFIERIIVSYDTKSRVFKIQGRDKTADILDSTLDMISDLRAPISLKKIIEQVVAHLNLKIKVIDEINVNNFDKSQDIISPEPGENAFKFIEKYARKRHVLITSNRDGDIVITRGKNNVGIGKIQHIIGADDNNVLSSCFYFDITNRFNRYSVVSQLNPVTLNNSGEIDIGTIVFQSDKIIDKKIRSSRQLTLIAESPNSNLQNLNRAKWEANIRYARSLTYSIVVSGHHVDPSDLNSPLWEINKLYQVIDNTLDKSELMLCNAVIFKTDLKNGKTTTLSFVGQNAYSLTSKKISTNKIADNIL